MAIADVNIGTSRIWLCAYNPAHQLSQAYCAFVVAKSQEALAGVAIDEVHAWIRGRFPDLEPLIEAAERGEPIPREQPSGTFPVTPGQEAFELPIIGHLKKREQQRSRANHGNG